MNYERKKSKIESGGGKKLIYKTWNINAEL